MATSYYLCKRNAKSEYEEIKRYWEEEFVKTAREMIINKCAEIDGEFINKDYATEILLPDYNTLTNYYPDFDIPTESEIGQFSSVNQCFEYGLSYDEIRIRNKEELEAFLKNNPEYFIYDESNQEFSLEQFLKKTKQI